MSIKFQQQIAVLQQVLSQYAAPQDPEATLRLTADALQHAFGQVRCLFYLADLPPEIQPFRLIPCPARRLADDIFVYDASSPSPCFTSEGKPPHCAPIALASRTFGYIFVQRKDGAELDDLAQELIGLLAVQAAHHLDHLRQVAEINQPELAGLEPLTIDEKQGLLWIDAQPLRLSHHELAAFQLLYQQQGQPCSRDALRQAVYQDEAVAVRGDRENRLDGVMHRLRAKLRRASQDRFVIENIRGIGYRLN